MFPPRPVKPVDPGTPGMPVNPTMPCTPIGPVAPIAPSAPGAPVKPVCPVDTQNDKLHLQATPVILIPVKHKRLTGLLAILTCLHKEVYTYSHTYILTTLHIHNSLSLFHSRLKTCFTNPTLVVSLLPPGLPSRTIVQTVSSELLVFYFQFFLVFLPAKAREYVFTGIGLCVCLSVCLSVTTITKKIVDGFVPNFMRRFLGVNRRPSSCFITIGRGKW